MENSCETSPRPKNVKEFFKSWTFWKPFLGVLGGATLGFLYYFYVGCSSGTCPITSSPTGSILFGGLMGLFITSSPCSRGNCK
jgi:hypothetical protein